MHLGDHLVDVCLFVDRRRETDPQVAIFFHDWNFLILQPPRAIANALRVSMDDHDAALRCSYAHLSAIGPGADLFHASRKRFRGGYPQHDIVRN